MHIELKAAMVSACILVKKQHMCRHRTTPVVNSDKGPSTSVVNKTRNPPPRKWWMCATLSGLLAHIKHHTPKPIWRKTTKNKNNNGKQYNRNTIALPSRANARSLCELTRDPPIRDGGRRYRPYPTEYALDQARSHNRKTNKQKTTKSSIMTSWHHS